MSHPLSAAEPRLVAESGPVAVGFLSVVVPVYNDAEGLRATAESLLAQSYPADHYEIILVDNASSDGTPVVAAELASNHPGRVRWCREPRKGSYAARNAGIRLARGEVLCFVDANVVAEQDFLGQVAECFADPDLHYLGCRITLTTGNPGVSATYDVLRGSVQREYLERSRFAVTAGMCVRRQVLEAVGEFDARLESNGDKEFGQRVHNAGFRQMYASHIVLQHPARETFLALAAKATRIGRGVAQLEHYYPDRYRDVARGVGYYRFRNYIPRRPSRIAGQLRSRGLAADPVRTVAISVLGIPLRVIGLIGYLKERRRLGRGGPAR